MERDIEDLHDLLAAGLPHSCRACFHCFGEVSVGVGFGQELLQALGHVLHCHLFHLPVGCNERQSDFAPEAGLYSRVHSCLRLDLDISLLDRVEATLQQRIRRIPDQATIGYFRLLALIHALDVALRRSLDGSLVVWAHEVPGHCRLGLGSLLCAGCPQPMRLQVLKQGLEGLDVAGVVGIDQVQEGATLAVLEQGVSLRLSLQLDEHLGLVR